jgi:hypothetical protein
MMGSDTSRTPPPLSPAVEAFLAHERRIATQPEMARARILARAREALREGDVVVLAPHQAPSPLRRLLYAAAASLVLTAGTAAAYQMLRRPAPVPPPAEGHTQVVPAVAEPTPASAPAPQAAPEPVAPAAPAVSPKASVPSRRTGVTAKNEARLEELRLLVRARQADARGDYLSVLPLLAEHERSFPTGRLSEEREVLRVKALVGLRRGSEARQVAANFRRQFPRSVLLHKIEDMLASLR